MRSLSKWKSEIKQSFIKILGGGTGEQERHQSFEDQHPKSGARHQHLSQKPLSKWCNLFGGHFSWVYLPMPTWLLWQ